MPDIKNDLFLRALNGETIERPHVWMMRQAGRYLPDFMKLREKYPFFDRVRNPDLVAEITVMPIDQVGVDAAILFSDILVIPQAMGVDVQMIPGTGPKVPTPIRTREQVDAIALTQAADSLGYVMEGIRATLDSLQGRVPLIGFAGAPWTVFCYMVEGQGSRGFYKAKEFCYKNPAAAEALLGKITEMTIDYLKEKVKAGVHALQLFDSWGGILSHGDYRRFSLPFIAQIVSALRESVPVIIFAKGCVHVLPDLKETGARALGVDWTVEPDTARVLTGPNVVLQGNFDPAKLLAPLPQIEQETREMVRAFGVNRYIANLGHGILPNIPVDHAKAFVNTVKEMA